MNETKCKQKKHMKKQSEMFEKNEVFHCKRSVKKNIFIIYLQIIDIGM